MALSQERIANLRAKFRYQLDMVDTVKGNPALGRLVLTNPAELADLLLILDEYRQMKAGESKCDRCPFGSMLKEYEDDDKAGGSGTVGEQSRLGSTPSPGLSEADKRALENIGGIIDDRVHAMRLHVSVYSSDRESAQMRAEAEQLAEDMAHLRSRLSATPAPPAVNTDTHRQVGPNTDTHLPEHPLQKLADNMTDIPPEFAKIAKDHFWEMADAKPALPDSLEPIFDVLKKAGAQEVILPAPPKTLPEAMALARVERWNGYWTMNMGDSPEDEQAINLVREAMSKPALPAGEEEPIQIVFDGPPAPKSGRFVEVEQGGKGINFGEWKHREDGYWVLELPRILFQPKPTVTRKWVDETATVIRGCPSFMDGETVGPTRYLAERLLDLGVTITDEEKDNG